MRLPMWQAGLGVFFLLTGFLAASQWHAGRPLRAQVQLPAPRIQQLALLLKRQEEAQAALEAEIAHLRQRALAYEHAVAEGQGAAETMAAELAQLRLVLGLVPVEGPGVEVRLSGAGAPGGILPVQIRAADLAGLVNELWSAGAEAVSVNGHRTLATTGFRDHADDVIVGTVALRPPFLVAAIGEPAVLQTALRLRGGFVEGLRSIGLSASVQRRAQIRLEAYRGPLLYRHARPGPEPGP